MSLKSRLNALERSAGRDERPEYVVTEPDAAGGLRAIALADDGPIELRRIRKIGDRQWVFTTDPGTPAQLKAEATMTDDELLADAASTVVVQHLVLRHTSNFG
jgi:hypothetical protein